jgi:hypothetical protein
MILAENTSQQQEEPSLPLGVDIPEVSPEVIDKVLEDPYYMDKYHQFTNLPWKFALAMALIEDGRVENPAKLAEDFLPKKYVVDSHKDPTRKRSVKDQLATVGQTLYERLSYELVKRDKVKTPTKEGHAAQRHIKRVLAEDPDVQYYVDAKVPLDIIGQIKAIDEFSDISDAKKLAHLRAWLTRSLLHLFVGKTKGFISRNDTTPYDLLDKLPRQIFKGSKDEMKLNVVLNFMEQQFMKRFTDIGFQNAIRELNKKREANADPDERKYEDILYERFERILTMPHNPAFKERITVNGVKRKFPSFEQLAFAHDFISDQRRQRLPYDPKNPPRETRLLAAETGLGKTLTAYLAMEESDADAILILAPANGLPVWPAEAKKGFVNPNRVHVVADGHDLLRIRDILVQHAALEPEKDEKGKPLPKEKQYVVVSHQLLSNANQHPHIHENLMALVEQGHIDGAIIDEIDNFRNPKAERTKEALVLFESINKNYYEKRASNNYAAPIVGLSATPIRTGAENFDIPMAMLYPNEFKPSTGDAEKDKDIHTFSNSFLHSPELIHLELIGHRRMFRWEQASGVQEFEPEAIFLEPSAFEDYFYRYLVDEVEALTLDKCGILSDALLNPVFAKLKVRELLGDNVPVFDREQAVGALKKIYATWKDMHPNERPTDPEEFLSQDRLVELGFGEMVLGAFFTDMPNGIDTFIADITSGTDDPELGLAEFWMNRELSTKYQVIKEILVDGLTWKIDENGDQYRSKVTIILEDHIQGRNREFEQRQKEDEDGNQVDVFNNEELKIINDEILLKKVKEWVAEYDLMDPTNVLIYDGSIPTGKPRMHVNNLGKQIQVMRSLCLAVKRDSKAMI